MCRWGLAKRIELLNLPTDCCSVLTSMVKESKPNWYLCLQLLVSLNEAIYLQLKLRDIKNQTIVWLQASFTSRLPVLWKIENNEVSLLVFLWLLLPLVFATTLPRSLKFFPDARRSTEDGFRSPKETPSQTIPRDPWSSYDNTYHFSAIATACIAHVSLTLNPI
jgi:hypothetical protein